MLGWNGRPLESTAFRPGPVDPLASFAHEVGQRSPSIELSADSPDVGVEHSEHEDPGAKVRSAAVTSPEPKGTDSIAERHEVTTDGVEPAADPARDVFDDDRRRLALLDVAAELSPEAGALAFEASSLAGGADVLAGEAARHDVDSGKRSSCSNIREYLDSGEVVLQSSPAP
jgi:hypothetical protein